MLKKEVFVHASFLLSFFIFISIVKNWLGLAYWPLWLGGIIGTLLPDIDHLIYVYFLRPQELTSQRVVYLMNKKDYRGAFRLLIETKNERTKLIFHTVIFQLIFLVLAFLIITSSGNLFGRGLVLAFLLHFSVDQMVDISQTGVLTKWFSQTPIILENKQATSYFLGGVVTLLILGFLL
jgi:hypothetical protein